MKRSMRLKACAASFLLILFTCTQALADLPQFADLAEKAGLDADAWKSGAEFQTFQAIVFGEKEKRK